MTTCITRRAALGGIATTLALAACGQPSAGSQEDASPQEVAPPTLEALVDAMSCEQMVAQLVVPALSMWNEQPLTDLAAAPELADALRRRQYAGIVLLPSNVVDAAQTATLVRTLQAAHAEGAADAQTAPTSYFVCVEQAGGARVTLPMATRGVGNMALGATGSEAVQNAIISGQVVGEELSALGINTNLAPNVDVIRDLASPDLSTDVFSTDVETIASLADAFADGEDKSSVISTFGHFPGIGDGANMPSSTPVTLNALRETGLASFASVIENGAEVVRVSGMTFSAFDNEHLLADGETRGYYPATMSSHIVTNLLREELGFDGVVMSAALHMDRFLEEADTHLQLFPTEPGTVEYAVAMAEACLQAGCDLLLLPVDLTNVDQIGFLDAYVSILAAHIDEGTLSRELVRSSVIRVLSLKEKHGLLQGNASQQAEEPADSTAGAGAAVNGSNDVASIVGSQQHHNIEQDIAEQAITMLENDGIVPIPGSNVNVLFMCANAEEAAGVEQALVQLAESRAIDTKALIKNNVAGTTTGPKDARTVLSIERYLNAEGTALEYPKNTTETLEKADYVVCLSSVGAGVEQLQDSNPRIQGVSMARVDAKKAKVPFVLLSIDLPVDVARFSDAEVIMCAYLAAGIGIVPEKPASGDASQSRNASFGAVNANVPAALRAIFGAIAPAGTLPIRILGLRKGEDGRWAYTKKTLYERGAGR